MSWLAKNYEKAAIGGATAVALGLVFLGWSQINSVQEDFGASLSGRGNNDPAVKNADLIPRTLSSMKLGRASSQAEVDDRSVDLFVGIPLFVGKQDPSKPIDPYKGEPIHPPIANMWWIENKLDPGFADSPQRDPDQDGFSNLEEYNGKTNPNDAKSHPALISKLKYLRDESMAWVLRPGFESEGGFTFKYEDSKRQTNAANASALVMPDTLFFTAGAAKERFKLLGSEKRKEFNPKIKQEMEFTIVKVADQRPNKLNKVYEIPAPLSEERKMEHVQYDRTAIFSLEAIGMAGTEFKVEENTPFALPTDAPDKKFLTKEVTPEAVIVEYTDAAGAKTTVKIPKGAFPQTQE